MTHARPPGRRVNIRSLWLKYPLRWYEVTAMSPGPKLGKNCFMKTFSSACQDTNNKHSWFNGHHFDHMCLAAAQYFYLINRQKSISICINRRQLISWTDLRFHLILSVSSDLQESRVRKAPNSTVSEINVKTEYIFVTELQQQLARIVHQSEIFVKVLTKSVEKCWHLQVPLWNFHIESLEIQSLSSVERLCSTALFQSF